MANNKVGVWDLEDPVQCPECGEWHELQSSKPRDPDRLLCPECYDAEKRFKKGESLLESRVKDLEIENQDLRDSLTKVVAPAYKYRSRLVGFILALLDRVYITDEVKDQLVKNAYEGKYTSVVVGESFIDLHRNDGTKDHVRVFF